MIPTRPATGYALPVRVADGAPPAGQIYLTTVGGDPTLGEEGYELAIVPSGVLSSSAVSVMNLPESASVKIPRWAEFERRATRKSRGSGRHGGGRNRQQKGGPRTALLGKTRQNGNPARRS